MSEPALHPSVTQEGNGVLACAGWPVAGRRVSAEIEEGETEMDPIFVFIMNDRNCQAALAVPGAPVGPHNDPHLLAMSLVKYIVQEMSGTLHIAKGNLYTYDQSRIDGGALITLAKSAALFVQATSLINQSCHCSSG